MLIHDMQVLSPKDDTKSGSQHNPLRLDSTQSIYAQTLDLKKEGLLMNSHLTSQESQRTTTTPQPLEQVLASDAEWINIQPIVKFTFGLFFDYLKERQREMQELITA